MSWRDFETRPVHVFVQRKATCKFVQQILGCGDIKVTGVGSGEIILKNIDNPMEVQKKINELRQWDS